MTRLSAWKPIFLLSVFSGLTTIVSPAQTGCSAAAPCFKTLVSFNGSDGASPYSLVQGRNGNFYGPTRSGGVSNYGTIFRITSSGTLITLHNFNGTDGSGGDGLVLATNGNFYGTGGGGVFCDGRLPEQCGTFFKITPGGTLTALYDFESSGIEPNGLVQATDGNFYGTTSAGGTFGNSCAYFGCGTVFKITSGGALTALHNFDGTDGEQPDAGLVQATDGNFYGTTVEGGGNDLCTSCGTVFKITPEGTLTTLHNFGGADGEYPTAGLAQATDGDFYGTTQGGGASGDGTIFKITAAGALTTLHSFDGTDGESPTAGLVQATDGNFYGTTERGGASGDGTIFRITPAGALTTLHDFDGTDGELLFAGLVQAADGNFYGATPQGGADNDGTVFSLSVGLGPFVEAVTYSGKVGNTIEILGQDFISSTSVYFNGIAATRKVISSTYLTAVVPTGATTGYVTVTTSAGTLKSNKRFVVVP
jgi:uncharacterized repeat protein (TIGR03803 family)